MKMFDDFMDFLTMDIFGRWFIRLLIIFAVSMAFLTSIGVAQAQTQYQAQQCDQHTKVLDQLARKYQEAPVAVGVVANGGGLVELLTTSDGATWTLIVSMPNGISCLIAAGENWRSLTLVGDTRI